MAHYGFPDGFGEVWRELPEPTPIEVQLWHVPASELPHGTDERIAWLFGWWETLDAWVGERSAGLGELDRQARGGGAGAPRLRRHGEREQRATTEPKSSNVVSSPSGSPATPARIAGSEIAR